MKNALFEDDTSGDDNGFKTNKDYAKSYNKYRQKELLKKLKDKESGGDSGTSSDSNSSDDDETAFNPKFDVEFYKTLSSLKRKDPTIYDKSTQFFDGDDLEISANGPDAKKKAKKLTIKQYEQSLLLKNGGKFDADSDHDIQRAQSPTYNQEQQMIKDEILGRIGKIDESKEDNDDEVDDIGGLFSMRKKTKKEEEDDDKEQEKWIADHADINEKSVNEIWSNKKLSRDEKFLRDYILSNGYADKEDDEIPTYDEIIGDDEFEEKQTEFEHKYNFRFEDPDQEFIKRYPRTIENSVRKVDTRRKEKRQERVERKELEKKEKFQEIEMLKELKRKEIEEKIEQLKAVTGAEELNVDELDLDGDFVPEEYDEKMQAIFNSEYYDVDEGDEKPEAPSDIEDLQVENYDDIGAADNTNANVHCEDDDFNMDCDYDESHQDPKKSFQDEMIGSTRKRKRGKRKSKFMEMLEAEKPPFNPNNAKSFDEYLDEYYKLDCEDIIGDVKCRFKYVETAACDYGLSIEEILGAKNKELNAWASLKKATQIRPEHVERNEQVMFQRKAKNDVLKRKILRSLYEPSDDEAEVEEENQPVVAVNDKPLTQLENDDTQNSDAQIAKKKKKKEKMSKTNVNDSTEVSTCLAATLQIYKEKTENREQEIANKTKKESQPKQISKPASPKKQLQPKTSKEQPNFNSNKSSIDKFKANHKVPLKKVAHKTIVKKNNPNKNSKQNGLSDERLKAFGINPKKFVKKQKYAARNAKQNPSKKNASQAKFQNKMKNKLKKALEK